LRRRLGHNRRRLFRLGLDGAGTFLLTGQRVPAAIGLGLRRTGDSDLLIGETDDDGDIGAVACWA